MGDGERRTVSAGPLDALPRDRCVAVDDGRVVVVRNGDELVAFPNRCLHQDSPLDGGWVRDGILSCPLHFWRYRLDGGALVGGGVGDRLELLPVAVEDGEVRVTVPDRPVADSLRDQLLARARDYDRTRAYEDRRSALPPPPGPDRPGAR